MKLSFTYDRGQGEESTTVGPMAIVGFELENKTKISRLADTGIGMGDMTDLVFRQLELEGRVTGTLDEFRRSLIDIDPIAPDDPTRLREEASQG